MISAEEPQRAQSEVSDEELEQVASGSIDRPTQPKKAEIS